ncbi:M43 family zinc metalloprotease [Flavobacterium pallidum]|uniref:PKD domain-containing protein n=1 Tax=Flavobacterium pallidum TaxID=2172098 RepID=A0A2S1SK38_9FLAO|nr:M43 family zinc metalloprotease [Flavobacterium pallidum]AWI26731.1 hypothetical protein HYN49_12955 [Flavobacterium pallidum]
MKKYLLLLLLLTASFMYAQREKQPYCITDVIMEKSIKEHPEIKERIAAMNRKVAESDKRALMRSGSEMITIPVVVYILHAGVNNPENISDPQVQSQMSALNMYFNPYGIQFCLATRGNNTASIPLKNTSTDVQNTPGIIHVLAPTLIDHDYTPANAKALMNTAHPSISEDKYLRIWVVRNITVEGVQGTVGGYSMFPGNEFQGAVMDYNFFGNISTCSGCDLRANYDQGKILVHEVGHYLGLQHTFFESCSGMNATTCSYEGDFVCDTPPVQSPNWGCVVGTNSCNESPDLPDNIHNYMDYGNSACLYEFTPGQVTRMKSILVNYRSTLFSNDNLIATGTCGFEGLISATFTADKYAICHNNAIQFSGIYQDDVSYSWDFGDGNTGSGQNISHTYTTGSTTPYTVTLTVTDNTKTDTFSDIVWVTQCAQLQKPDAYWYLGYSHGLNFASGVPSYDTGFPVNHPEVYNASSQSSTTGSLLFYCNENTVWDSNHALVSNGLFPNAYYSTTNLIIPKPGNSSKYYIFTLGGNTSTGELDGLRRNTINANGSNISAGTLREAITIPIGQSYDIATDGAIRGAIGLTAIEKCDGYWILALLKKSNSYYITVYSLSNAATNDMTYIGAEALPVGNSYPGELKFSPNGNKLLYFSSGATNSLYKMFLYDFDKNSGALSNRFEIIAEQPSVSVGPVSGVSFSTDSKLLYIINNSADSIVQYNLNDMGMNTSRRTVGKFSPLIDAKDMQLGPDGKIYVSRTSTQELYTIHRPNALATSDNTNACYFSYHGPNTTPVGSNSNRHLPNPLDARAASVYDPTEKISVYATPGDCNRYKFFPNICATGFKWEFKNVTTNQVVYSPIVNTPTYSFSITGNYVITLKDSNDQPIASTNLAISALSQPIVLGSTTTCTADPNSMTNNSIHLQPGETAAWSITSGAGTFQSSPNNAEVSIHWTTLPATLSVTITNSNGCTATNTKNITSSCVTVGANNTVYATALQTDGKIVFGGDFTAYSGTTTNRLGRLKSDMTYDSAFNSGSGPNNSVKTLAMQADGKIVIGGNFTSYNGISKNGVARINPNGSLETAFTANLNSGGYINAIAIQTDGKIIIGGKFTSCNGTARINIVRLNTNGTVDTSFSSGFNNISGQEVNCIAIQPNGRIVVGGSFVGYSGNNNVKRIVRLTTNGALDSSFVLTDLFFTGSGSPDPSPVVNALKVLSNGKIMLTGTFTTYNQRNCFLRIMSDGTIDPQWGEGIPIISSSFGTGIKCFGIQNDKAIIGGGFQKITSIYHRRRIARLDVTTEPVLDTSFNPGEGFGPMDESLASVIYSITLQPDGKIICAGKFTDYNGIVVNNITRIDNVNSGSINRPAPQEPETEIDFTNIDKDSFDYYPNPVENVLTLTNTKNITSVEVYNMIGQRLIVKNDNSTTSKVDMSALPNGSYVVKMTADGMTKTVKVLKQ